jgi:hypothetical protein
MSTDNSENNNNSNNFEFRINTDDDNAHDRNVNELSKRYFGIIKKDQGDKPLKKFDDVISCLNNQFTFEELSYQKKHIISFYINYIIKNKEHIMHFDCPEDEFFLYCWNRVYNIENKENEKNIKESIFNNIFDSYTKEILVDFSDFQIKTQYRLLCTMGRVNRLLSSFAFLDFNKELGLYISVEMLKHDFLGKASVLYSEELLKEEYIEILDEMIANEYDVKYISILNKFKEELINSLIFKL